MTSGSSATNPTTTGGMATTLASTPTLFATIVTTLGNVSAKLIALATTMEVNTTPLPALGAAMKYAAVPTSKSTPYHDGSSDTTTMSGSHTKQNYILGTMVDTCSMKNITINKLASRYCGLEDQHYVNLCQEDNMFFEKLQNINPHDDEDEAIDDKGDCISKKINRKLADSFIAGLTTHMSTSAKDKQYFAQVKEIARLITSSGGGTKTSTKPSGNKKHPNKYTTKKSWLLAFAGDSSNKCNDMGAGTAEKGCSNIKKMNHKIADSIVDSLTNHMSISANDLRTFVNNQLAEFNAANKTNTNDKSLNYSPEQIGCRYMNKLDYIFIPFILLIQKALTAFTLGKHVIDCMSTIILYITSQRNKIMYTVLALEEYVLFQALLALIYIAYHGSLTSMNILQTLWLAFTFGLKMYWYLLGP